MLGDDHMTACLCAATLHGASSGVFVCLCADLVQSQKADTMLFSICMQTVCGLCHAVGARCVVTSPFATLKYEAVRQNRCQCCHCMQVYTFSNQILGSPDVPLTPTHPPFPPWWGLTFAQVNMSAKICAIVLTVVCILSWNNSSRVVKQPIYA